MQGDEIPFLDKRPWGQEFWFAEKENCTVKLLEVNAGEAFSLQYHKKERKEFWYILEGNPIVTFGEETIVANPGDKFMIKEQMKHRIDGGETGTRVLELILGDFDENDIIRLEDKYGRK